MRHGRLGIMRYGVQNPGPGRAEKWEAETGSVSPIQRPGRGMYMDCGQACGGPEGAFSSYIGTGRRGMCIVCVCGPDAAEQGAADAGGLVLDGDRCRPDG